MSRNTVRNERVCNEAIKQQIKVLIAEDLDVNVGFEDIGDEVSLLEKGLALDSVVIVELINLLETEFGFQFGDEDMKPELFESLTALSEFVAAKTASATPLESRS